MLKNIVGFFDYLSLIDLTLVTIKSLVKFECTEGILVGRHLLGVLNKMYYNFFELMKSLYIWFES